MLHARRGATAAEGAAPSWVKELSLTPAGSERQSGRLVVGLNPRRPFDDQYRAFVDLVADQLRTGARQRPGLRAGAAARRSARRTGPREDGVLQQRQPRVPHAADAAGGAARRRPGRFGHTAAAGAPRAAGGGAPQRAPPAAARQHAAGFLPHRGRPHRRELRTDRPRAVHRPSSRASSGRRSKRPVSPWSSPAILWPSPSTSIATCGRRSS